MRNVAIDAGDVFFMSWTRQQYDTGLAISSGFTSNAYNIMPESGVYQMYLKHNGGNLATGTVIKLDYYLHPTALSAVTESPPGILDDYDDAVISRTIYYYMKSQGKYDIMGLQLAIAKDLTKDMRHELRTQGEPQSIVHQNVWY